MEYLKVRKIGNSLGVILPKSARLKVGEQLAYYNDGHTINLDMEAAQKARARAAIEASYVDFDCGNSHTEEEMKRNFGKYGWGRHEARS